MASSNDVAPVVLTIGTPAKASWTVSSDETTGGYTISIAIPGLVLRPVDGGYAVGIPGQAVPRKGGVPDLASLAKLLPAMPMGHPVVRVQGCDPTNITGVVVAPAPGMVIDEMEAGRRRLVPERKPDPSVFEADAYWPSTLGNCQEASIGTQKVVRLECFPVQYNPVARSIRFYRRMELDVRFERE